MTDMDEGIEVLDRYGTPMGTTRVIWLPTGEQPQSSGTLDETVERHVRSAVTSDDIDQHGGEPVVDNTLLEVVRGVQAAHTGAGHPGYLQMDVGGVLGLRARTLYIPFTLVSTALLRCELRLKCTRDEAMELFATKPHDLKTTRSPA